MTDLSPRKRALLITLIALLVSSFYMFVYLSRTLEGNINHHVLPSKVFGIPEDLKKHGYDVKYTGDKESGWDGQFYFSIANDPFALKDTPKHIDADAYRYQRVGLPLIAWLISKVTFQSWVSPTLYYLTNFGLVLLATYAAAAFLIRRDVHPGWILFWSLAIGTQITVMNGLPDGAADALLILALISLLDNKPLRYVVCVSFASLSREAYVVFPAVLGAHGLFQALADPVNRRLAFAAWMKHRAWIAAVPVLVFIGWQLFVRIRFHTAPSSQAHNILGLPFKAWFVNFSDAVMGRHFVYRDTRLAKYEACALVAFILLGIGALVGALRMIRSDNLTSRSIGLATFVLIALYSCFGNTVMFHYTGFMKAAGLFILIVPIAWASTRHFHKFAYAVLFLICCAFLNRYLWLDRVSPWQLNYDAYTRLSQIKDDKPRQCLSTYAADLKLTGMEEIRTDNWITRLTWPNVTIFRVILTNQSSQLFESVNAKGGVNVSYHWLTADGKTVVKDGIRSAIPGGLAPGASATVPIWVEYPQPPGDYLLRLTMVQEGCAWFYQANPSSALDIAYKKR